MSNEETKDVDMADASAPAAEGEVSNLHMCGWVLVVSISVYYPQPSVSSDPVPHPAAPAVAGAFQPAEAAPELHQAFIQSFGRIPSLVLTIVYRNLYSFN